MLSMLEAPNNNTFVRGRASNIPTSFCVTFHILGLLPFSGSFRVMMCFSESMFVRAKCFAFPHLIAVSLSSCRKVAVLGPVPLISESTSASVGMKGNF